MNYKVGDRVWVKEHKEYGVIKLVRIVIKGGFEIPFYTLNNGFNYLGEHLHDTARTMFEALGGQLEVGKKGVFYWYLDLGFVEFDKNSPEIYETNIEMFTVKEHLAIHQQLIELGWNRQGLMIVNNKSNESYCLSWKNFIESIEGGK